ncbi:MAG: MerR family transcriptional regulator [Oscillospiraceae bacterium]
MKTVKQVSQLAGISVRTLHYYDSIGLLPPTQITQAGYRLYDDRALVRLQCIFCCFGSCNFPARDQRNSGQPGL